MPTESKHPRRSPNNCGRFPALRRRPTVARLDGRTIPVIYAGRRASRTRKLGFSPCRFSANGFAIPLTDERSIRQFVVADNDASTSSGRSRCAASSTKYIEQRSPRRYYPRLPAKCEPESGKPIRINGAFLVSSQPLRNSGGGDG